MEKMVVGKWGPLMEKAIVDRKKGIVEEWGPSMEMAVVGSWGLSTEKVVVGHRGPSMEKAIVGSWGPSAALSSQQRRPRMSVSRAAEIHLHGSLLPDMAPALTF